MCPKFDICKCHAWQQLLCFGARELGIKIQFACIKIYPCMLNKLTLLGLLHIMEKEYFYVEARCDL